MICHNCGNSVNSTDTYCTFCGARVHRQVMLVDKPSTPKLQSRMSRNCSTAPNDKNNNSKKNIRALLFSVLGIVIAIVVAALIFNYINHRNEEALWAETVEKKQIDAYRTYLEKYPSGEHSDEARDMLNKLINEKDAWERASASSDEDHLRAYIRNNPNSTHLEEAKKLLDDAVWARISAIKTKDAYKQYLDEFPNGIHYTEATNLLEEIQEKERSVLTSAERDNVKSTVRNFLMGLEQWDANLMLSTCNTEMISFMGKRPASLNDVREYYDAFSESDIDSIGFSSLEVDVKKIIRSDKKAEFKVSFSATRKLIRRDYDEETIETVDYMKGQAVIDDRFYFKELTMNKE